MTDLLKFFIAWCTLASLAGAVLGYLGYRAKSSAPAAPKPGERHTASTITDDALDALYTRIAQAEDLLGVANETSNTSEAARALAVERAELAERAAAALLDRVDALSLALFDTANYIRDTGRMYPAERRLLDQAVEAQRWCEPSWRCPSCDGSVPYHQRHEHLTAEAEQRAQQAEAATSTLLEERATLALLFEGFDRLLATSSRDWSEYCVDAWLWAVVCGWDCAPCTDPECTHDVLEWHARKFGWGQEGIDKARRYHAAVLALTIPKEHTP